MLQINFIRQNKEEVISRLKIKHFDAAHLVEMIIRLDEQRRELQTKTDETLAEANQIAKSIGQLYKSGRHQEAGEMKDRKSVV